MILELQLTRFAYTRFWTLGQLYANSDFLCFALEDPDRLQFSLPKLATRTAIPAGRYQVLMTMSHRFGRIMPQLVDVPGFSGIRIHPGNTAQNTEGCILLGMGIHTDGTLNESKKAVGAIEGLIRNAQQTFLTITRMGPSDGWRDALTQSLAEDHKPAEA